MGILSVLAKIGEIIDSKCMFFNIKLKALISFFIIFLGGLVLIVSAMFFLYEYIKLSFALSSLIVGIVIIIIGLIKYKTGG